MIKETNQRIVKVHFKDDGFWDMIADQETYEDFYDFCECVDDVSYDDFESMLSCKGIEVVFSEED